MDPTSTSVSVEIEPEMVSNMPSEPPASTSLQPPPNLHSGDLLGNREQYRRICIPLYEASVKGNWNRAEGIINQHQAVTGYSITENGDTALHIAASAISTKLKLMEDFVRKLVSKMKSEDILLQNRRGNTALCLAAARGNVSIAEIIVGSNRDVLNIPGNKGMLPLYIASFYRKYEMVKYLYEESNNTSGEVWTHRNRVWVLLRCVEADFFDIALKIVTGRPELATSGEILRVLARKTDAFREIKPHFIGRVISRIIHGKVAHVENEGDVMKLLRFIWTYIMENLDKPQISNIIGRSANNELQEDEPTTSHVHPRSQSSSSQVLFIAAKMGNSKFIVELIRQYPDLIWKLNDSNQSIFHVAVSHRQEGVYNLMYEIGWIKDLVTTQVDMDGNSMLHLAAKSAKKKRLQEISGVALQMHRELLWYKEVKGVLPPFFQGKKNNEGLLPHELFTTDHKDLMSASERWMKDTASHCMVVAALIATVVFAAAFTVPGGYNNANGIPILQNYKAFIIFVISDAISLTFATISILVFLYILTSRYAEQDFLDSLPKKLLIGIATLFLSIAAMMVAFSVSFFSLYDSKLIWVPSLITVSASMPIFLYVRLQYDLLADVYHSTYGSKNLFKPKEPMLY